MGRLATLPCRRTMVTTKTRMTNSARPSAMAMLRPRRAFIASSDSWPGWLISEGSDPEGQRARAQEVFAQQGGEKQAEVEDREGEQVARVLGPGAHVVEAVIVALADGVAGLAARQAPGQQQEHRAAQRR